MRIKRCRDLEWRMITRVVNGSVVNKSIRNVKKSALRPRMMFFMEFLHILKMMTMIIQVENGRRIFRRRQTSPSLKVEKDFFLAVAGNYFFFFCCCGCLPESKSGSYRNPNPVCINFFIYTGF